MKEKKSSTQSPFLTKVRMEPAWGRLLDQAEATVFHAHICTNPISFWSVSRCCPPCNSFSRAHLRPVNPERRRLHSDPFLPLKIEKTLFPEADGKAKRISLTKKRSSSVAAGWDHLLRLSGNRYLFCACCREPLHSLTASNV